jgi:hypothetical protein
MNIVKILKIIGGCILALIALLVITGKVDEAVTVTQVVGGGIAAVGSNIGEFFVKLIELFD